MNTATLRMLQGAVQERAKRKLVNFAQYMKEDFQRTKFHENYYEILDAFARGKIKKLIVSVPPQHGKSEGSSRLLPAYMLGNNPDLRVGVLSYSSGFAKKFNRAVQRLIISPEYQKLYPGTRTRQNERDTLTTQTATEFEIVGHTGSLLAVGRGGAITGNKLDVAILDDMYKDFMEANSPITRETVWDFYINVVKTRLHNDSQELIVFTRWHDDDLIGRIGQVEDIIPINDLAQLDDIPEDAWAKVNFEAIKESEPTAIDSRDVGQALWPKMHNKRKLLLRRKLDANRFDCMYQGNPEPKEGLLYGDFETYTKLPPTQGNGNYTDTADSGDDYLCSISYRKGRDKIYVTDILYTQEPMEVAEERLPMMFERSDTRYANVESNAGGRYFAVKLSKKTRTKVKWFYQKKNKEARILTNAGTVNEAIVFPVDWQDRWPTFAAHVRHYKRIYRANKYNDAPDVLTGIVEKEVFARSGKMLKRIG